MQLGLDPQYPGLRQSAEAMERSYSRATSWHSNSTAADLLPPFALWTAFPPSLVGR